VVCCSTLASRGAPWRAPDLIAHRTYGRFPLTASPTYGRFPSTSSPSYGRFPLTAGPASSTLTRMYRRQSARSQTRFTLTTASHWADSHFRPLPTRPIPTYSECIPEVISSVTNTMRDSSSIDLRGVPPIGADPRPTSAPGLAHICAGTRPHPRWTVRSDAAQSGKLRHCVATMLYCNALH
jgi:hypothetical protein